jgi:RNA polymerase sigma-70 factor (ECF subfamily)
MHRGPAEGIVALATLEPELASYHLFYAVRADLRSRLGENARDDYRRAFELATNAAERRHLQQKMNR